MSSVKIRALDLLRPFDQSRNLLGTEVSDSQITDTFASFYPPWIKLYKTYQVIDFRHKEVVFSTVKLLLQRDH